jgi:hypothetical protein
MIRDDAINARMQNEKSDPLTTSFNTYQN